MNKTNLITIIIFILVFIFGFFLLIFWKIGVFKESYKPSELLEKIQNQLDFIKNYNLKESESVLQNLSIEKVSLPQIQNEEIGRSFLFDNPK